MISPKNQNVEDKVRIIEGIDEIPGFNGYFVDVWGILFDGRTRTPIADELLCSLCRKGKVVLISNSSRTSDEMRVFLERNNINTENVSGIITSGDLIKDEIKKQTDNNKKFHIVGEVGESYWLQELSKHSVSRVKLSDFIITANHIYETDAELHDKISIIKEKGMKVLSTNPDKFVNLSGFIQKTGGYFCDMARAAGVEVIEYGKPHSRIFSQALSSHNLLASETCMVGDSLDTDIKDAKNSGIY